MKFGQFYVATPFFDSNDPGGAPAAPAAPSSPTPGGNPSAPTPGASAVGTPAVPAAQPQAPTGFNYKEDRSNWVPSHVVRQRTQELEQFKRDLHYERQRVAALSGVQMPAAPRNPENDAIRNQLLEVMPELKDYLDMKDKLKAFSDFDPKEITAIRESQNQSWAARGNETLRTLTDKVKQAYGGADLSPKQMKRIASAFVTEVGEDPELRARYESGDLSIVDEFVADFTGGVLTPYQRSNSVAQQTARQQASRLPRGGGSSAVVGARPAALKPSDPGFHEAAFKRFEQ